MPVPAYASQFSMLVNNLVKEWESIKPRTSSWGVDVNAISNAFEFLVNGLEKLVNLMEQFNVPGADKKTIVMGYGAQLFDNVIAPLLPVWLPKVLVKTVFTAVLSGVVEFLVTKLDKVDVAPVNPV